MTVVATIHVNIFANVFCCFFVAILLIIYRAAEGNRKWGKRVKDRHLTSITLSAPNPFTSVILQDREHWYGQTTNYIEKCHVKRLQCYECTI